MAYDYVNLSEKELEHLIQIYPDKIEDGLKFVDHQKKTERGPLDILFIDSGNALIVSELKIIEDDDMLFQGIDYYNDVNENLESLARLYNKINFKIDPTQTPRLILVAPTFSIRLIKRCTWIDIPISLYSYKCIKPDGSKDIIPVFNEIPIPSNSKPTIEVYNIEDRFNYIKNESAKNRFKKLLNMVKELDNKNITTDAIKYEISVKISGKVLAYFCPRRDFFLIWTYDRDSVWKQFKINSDDDVIELFDLIRDYYEKIKK
jgi:hypothetical protein